MISDTTESVSISDKDDFVRSVVLVVVFLLLTPIAIVSSLFTLFSISAAEEKGQVLGTNETMHNYVIASSTSRQVYGSLPDSLPAMRGETVASDARAAIVRQYLERYDSPMVHLADYIVQKADENELDFRLLTAIAQQESNLCKKIPPETYNCWGWGIHTRGTLGFESFEHGIDVVSRGLKQNYLDLGYTTPEEIMSKYTPSSNGSWAAGVSEFMEEML